MSHINKQIRNVFATLVTGLATTGANVFQDRNHPLAATDMPGLRVYVQDSQLNDSLDTQSTDAAAPFLQRRDINLVCECLAKTSSTMEDTLDEIALEVEKAIAANPLLGLAKLPSRLKNIQTQVGYATDVAAGQATMNWHITVFTMSNAPDVAV